MSKTKKKTSKSTSVKFSLRDIDKPLLVAIIILVILGTLSIVSASSRETVLRYNYSVYHYFYRHLAMIIISLVLSLIIIRVPTRYYRILGPILWLAILTILVGMFVHGVYTRGATRWFTIFGFQFQPSEFAKPVIIVTLAIFFEALNRQLKKPGFKTATYTAWWLGIGMIIPMIVFYQGDLGTALIIMLTAGLLYLSTPLTAKTKFKHVSTLGLIALGGFGIITLAGGQVLSDTQMKRITTFHNPCSRYEEYGFQTCNGLIAINEGRLTGVGIGQSRQKYSYIPDPHTDMIFAIIVEEAGLILGVIIIFLYGLVIARLIRISNRSVTDRGKYIAFGVAIYAFGHIVANLGGLLAIIPLTGVPLPLISYGGSFTIAFLCSIAIVQRVNIETREKERSLELKKNEAK